MSSLSASDAIRLRTWAVEIAVALLPEGTDRRVDGVDTRFPKTGGLCINRKNGAWYVHSINKGGWGTVGLIKHLRHCSTEDAFQWSSAWLAAHPGAGSCDGGDPEEEEAGASALASAEYAQELLSAAVPVEGTVGEVYLRARALLPPYPECVKFVPDVRTGEHGLLGILTARGRIVGAQLGYLTPNGTKTLVLPARRVFRIDRDAGREGVFDMKVPVGAVHSQQTTSDRIFVEGLENALSLWTAKAAPQIQGIPGIGRLEHMKVRSDERIVVLRDGDPPGSAADKAVLAGMDSLLLQGASVSVTATPAGEDANSLHLRKDGLASLLELIKQATPSELSLNGEVIRLSRLDAPEYDQERMAIAKKLRIRVATLDDLVKVARPKLATTAAAANEEEDPPWEGEVVLRDVLDAALVEIRRYVIAPNIHLGTIVVWAALTHITHSEHVRLQKSPRLAILSRVPGSGKTTGLDIVCSLSLRGTMASSFTASSVLRGMDADKPTLLLDEVDGVVWSTNSELGSILKAGDRRRSAIVKRSVPTPDGGWEVRDFCVWGPVAFAAINELPQPIQERSLCIWLERALGGDALEHLQDGTSPRLVELRRQLKAWGDLLIDLPDPDLPEVLRRQPARLSDNWRPIMALAQLAGGQWPALITEAIEAAVVEEQRPNTVMRLLRSILRAFNAQAEKDAAAIKLAMVNPESRKSYNDRADNALRLTTPTLLRHHLLLEEEEEWATANRGRAINPYYLRHQLRHLLKPEGAMDWWTGPAGNRKHHSGYTREQFRVAWATILPGEVGEDEAISSLHAFPDGSGVSGASGVGNPRSAIPDTPDEDRPAKNSSDVENRRNQRAAPDAPDTPDYQARVSGEGHAAGREPTRPNGASTRPDVAGNKRPTAQKSRSAAVQAVRDLRVEHPDWSTDRLARSLGVAEAKVLHALQGWEPPLPPSAGGAGTP